MKKLSLLLIDDDEIERMKFKRVCHKNGFPHEIFEAKNGEVALEVLKGDGMIPNIIVLDLNMPKMNGIEFLNVLKSDSELKYIPIIIMSSSSNFTDVKECYKIGIAGYIIKPLHFTDYTDRVVALLNYWSNSELVVD